MIQVDPKIKDNVLLGTEYFFGKHKMNISDSNIITNYREGEYLNLDRVYQFKNNRNAYDYGGSVSNDEVIHMTYLQMSAKGGVHRRTVTSFIDELSAAGGLLKSAVAAGFITYLLLVQPF